MFGGEGDFLLAVLPVFLIGDRFFGVARHKIEIVSQRIGFDEIGRIRRGERIGLEDVAHGRHGFVQNGGRNVLSDDDDVVVR